MNGSGFNTLGGKSKFTVENINNHLIITNSSGKKFKVTDDLAEAVLSRYESSPITVRNKTSNYTDPGWRDCPNRIVSPYVARIFSEELFINKPLQ